MNKKGGILHFIKNLIILSVFLIILYACLEIFGIIEVEEKYSVIKLLSNYGIDVNIFYDNEETNTIANEANKKKKIKIINKKQNNDETFYFNKLIENNDIVEETPDEIGNSDEFKYYDQLDNYGKIIYNKLNENIDNMKNGMYEIEFGDTFNDLLHEENGENILNNDFQLAINALNFDNPELFYLDISKIYLITTMTNRMFTGTKYTVKIGPNNGTSYLNSKFISETSVNYAVKNIEEQKNKILSSLEGTDEEKVRAVHQYLLDNVEYDKTTSLDNAYNIYGALINGYAVCEGYARAFKTIMDGLNIPCIIVCGTATNSNNNTENHAWNYVKLNEKWYAIDVTWDDPVIIGDGYISPSVNYKYYLKGSSSFFENHFEDGNIVDDAGFYYPTLCEDDFLI